MISKTRLHRVIALTSISILGACTEKSGPTTPEAEAPTIASVVVTSNRVTLESLGETTQVSATARDTAGREVSSASFRWTSSDVSVASVSPSGLVTARGEGTVTITAETGGVRGEVALVVSQALSTIAVDPPAATLERLGQSLRLAATGLDANGHPLSVLEPTWTSSDPSVVGVDESGLGTALGPGEAIVTASVSTVSGTARIGVELDVMRVEVIAPITRLTAIGQTVELEAHVLDEGGNAVEAPITWTSDDDEVVVIDAFGVATAITEGTAQVSATAAGVVGRATLSVEQVVAEIEITPSEVTLLSLRERKRLQARALDANGFEVGRVTFQWASSDPGVFTVDNAGEVTAMGNGSAAVTALGRGVNSTVGVTVRQVPARWTFSQQPGTVITSQVLTPGIEVTVYDALWNRVLAGGSPVTLSLGANPGGAQLRGTTTVTPVASIARYRDLSVTLPGQGYTLVAMVTGEVVAESDPFTVLPIGTPTLRRFTVTDPVGDQTGQIDVASMTVSFDYTSGGYSVTLTASPSHPFLGSFVVNLNLYNPGAGSLFQDTLNRYDLAVPTTTLVLTGVNPVLMGWSLGDRIYTNSLDGTPNPPGTTLYRSSVGNFPRGFLTNEDTIAFASLSQPAVVVQ